jgi:hypothetical protein
LGLVTVAGQVGGDDDNDVRDSEESRDAALLRKAEASNDRGRDRAESPLDTAQLALTI